MGLVLLVDGYVNRLNNRVKRAGLDLGAHIESTMPETRPYANGSKGFIQKAMCISRLRSLITQVE